MGKKLEALQLITLFIVFPILMFSVIHEQRHASIAESFGCNADINYIPQLDRNAFMYTTVTDCPKDLTEREYMMMRLMQSNVETTGYQLIPILMMTVIAVMFTYPNKKTGEEKSKKFEQVIKE